MAVLTEVALQKKLELREDLTKELVTKAEFYEETKTLRQEIELVRQEIQTMKVEIEGRINEAKKEV